MKLLITTQILDSQDSNLGAFHRWVEEFAAHCEQVIVICLKEGSHVLPANVRVLSLGKYDATKTSSIKRMLVKLVYAYRFYKYIRVYRNDYDAVFVHMNPEYVVLGGYFWRRWGKRVSLWYAHKSLTRTLSLAMRFVTCVFTVTVDSFPIRSPKVCAMGHGIDTALFAPTIHLESTQTRIVTVGRVAESKHVVEMLQVLDVLYAMGEKFSFTIVGEPTNAKEEVYAQLVREEVAKRPYAAHVRMVGAVPHHRLPEILYSHDVFFNFSSTGNMDKAGLEPLACGIPTLATNTAFRELLEPYGLFVSSVESKMVADALLKFLHRPDRPSIAAMLRNKVVAEHSLSKLIPKILTELQ